MEPTGRAPRGPEWTAVGEFMETTARAGRQGRLTPIDFAYAERRRKDIEAVVTCMEEIIQNKFSRKKKPRTSTRKSNPISH